MSKVLEKEPRPPNVHVPMQSDASGREEKKGQISKRNFLETVQHDLTFLACTCLSSPRHVCIVSEI